MFGPIEERRHDDFMLGMSDLLPKLHGFVQPNGQPYSAYGDPAYPITCNILAPFWGFNLTIHEQEFNRKMSKVRVNVEWGFGKICQNKLLAKRASGTPLLLTFSGERNSMQNVILVETWTTHSQPWTCLVHTKREIRLPVVVILGFRRRCLSSLIPYLMKFQLILTLIFCKRKLHLQLKEKWVKNRQCVCHLGNFR